MGHQLMVLGPFFKASLLQKNLFMKHASSCPCLLSVPVQTDRPWLWVKGNPHLVWKISSLGHVRTFWIHSSDAYPLSAVWVPGTVLMPRVQEWKRQLPILMALSLQKQIYRVNEQSLMDLKWCCEGNERSLVGDGSSAQFSHSVMSDSLRPHEAQDARPPCPSPTPGVHPNPCPLSQ